MLTYSELIKHKTYEARMEYLRVEGKPGELTFGQLRRVNQKFYRSRLWKGVRRSVIARDLGNDLGIPGKEIHGRIIVHHMNPVSPTDILQHSAIVYDPEYLITVSHDTHLGIHFGFNPAHQFPVERTKGDTKLW